ncbi:MAG: cyclodeaminase/cyclohydrolase family protein [Actinobacteria bacterium]|nr:cyclodeaminase/cyclohydrolase family protein [Actinomycetota bacterium]
MDTENYLDLPLRAFLDRLAAGSEAPGGGSAAALTVAFAAGLVAMVARCSKEWEEAGGIAAQALALQARAAPLAHADAEAWEDALNALRRAGAGGSDDGGARRDHALERKLERAAVVPLEIAALGADAAALAAVAGERCDAAYRADAAAAAALAAGGARAAAHLVEVNLGVREGDERLAQARASEQAAADAADRLLTSIR